MSPSSVQSVLHVSITIPEGLSYDGSVPVGNCGIQRSLTLRIFLRIGQPPVSSQRVLGVPILSSAFSLQVFRVSVQMFILPHVTGAGRIIGSPVGSHSFWSFSPFAAFRWH